MEGIPETDQEQQSLKKLKVNHNYDRISYLPDAILHYIFSFLRVKDVVRTCSVSKRWKNLPISLPYLHFREHKLCNKPRFINFVNNFLRRHDDSSIVEFRLSCSFQCDNSTVDEWISAAIRNRVEKLEVCIGDVERDGKLMIHSLPSCLFTSNSLVELKLVFPEFTRETVRFPENFCFPKMKSMKLKRVTVAKSFTDQLHNSPYIEKLYLSVILDINSSPSSHPVEGIFSNLKQAAIHFCFSRNQWEVLESIGGGGGFGVLKFIEKLSNVTYLHVSNYILKILQFEKQLSSLLPTFCNLKSLKLKFGSRGRDFDVMYCLLVRCPVIQSLDIIFISGEYVQYQQHFYSFSLPQSLELVRIKRFRGTEHQVELVNIFFISKYLKKIIVRVVKCEQRYRELVTRPLLSLPRPSLNCVYVIK